MGIGAAVLGSAAIGAGASFLSGRSQSKGIKGAAGLQAAAAQQSVDESRRQYDQTRTDLAPYRDVGATALGQYGALYGVGAEGMLSPEEMEEARSRFTTTPGYQFRVEEGTKALDRSAAARGGLRGGAHMRDLTRFGQGLASSEFDNYANRLAGLAGGGQQAAGQTAQAGMQSAGQVGNAYLQGAGMSGQSMADSATARASGYAGIGMAAQGGVQNQMLMQLLSQNQQNQQLGQGMPGMSGTY